MKALCFLVISGDMQDIQQFHIAMTFQLVTLLGNGPQAQEEAHSWDGPPTCATNSFNFVASEPQCKSLKTRAGSRICKQRTVVLET